MINKPLSVLCAALLLQGCGLKGDLYLEEEPEATSTEQEQTEYLEESVIEETEEIGPEDDLFDEEVGEILDAP